MKRLMLAVLLAGPLTLPAEEPNPAPSPDQTIATIESLVQKKAKDKKCVEFLSSALKNPDSSIHVKERAAWALGQLEIKKEVKTLIGAARNKSLIVRSAALGALQRIRAQEALPVLIEIAAKDPIFPMRVQATTALGVLKSGKAVEALVKLSWDEREELRGASALAMAATHSSQHNFKSALKEMTGDASPYVQDRARRAMEMIERKNAKVRELLSSEDGDLRYFAALYMQDHGKSADLKKLKEAANSDANDDVCFELDKAVKAVKKRIAKAEARAKAKALAKEKANSATKNSAPPTSAP